MTSVSTILDYISNNYAVEDKNQNMDAPMRAKKRRLDHLSWEEKVQRKKLKNRVAAQTSRDRKKAKMEQMEHALQEIFAKNESLMSECENLRTANQRLTEENAELRERLSLPCLSCNQNRSVECEAQNNGSTESYTLQPQGMATHSAAALMPQHMTQAILKLIVACLLYQTFSTNSTKTWTSTLLNNSPKAFCKISPETWKQLLKKQIVRNQMLIAKWWGRHQRSWNPMETNC